MSPDLAVRVTGLRRGNVRLYVKHCHRCLNRTLSVFGINATVGAVKAR